MTTFSDSTGRTWTIAVSPAAAAEVHETTGVDLLSALKHGRLFPALDDPARLGATLWALVRAQAHSEGVSREAFETALDGPALERAQEALVAALYDRALVAEYRGLIASLTCRLRGCRQWNADPPRGILVDTEAVSVALDLARRRLRSLLHGGGNPVSDKRRLWAALRDARRRHRRAFRQSQTRES